MRNEIVFFEKKADKKATLYVGLFVLVFCQIFFCFRSSLAAGHQQEGISIDQTVLSFALSPGESREFVIGVGNHSEKRQNISCTVLDVDIDDENQLKNISAGSEDSSLSGWVDCSDKQLILEPGDIKKVDFRLSVPQNASLGSHSAGIFFSAVSDDASQNSQNISVSARVGAHLLVNIAGASDGSGQIIALEAPFFYSDSYSLKVIFRNTGNIHYIPHGEIWVQNVFTRKKIKMEIEKHFVFPGKEFSFKNSWQGGSDFGAYIATAYFVDGNQKIQLSKKIIVGKAAFSLLMLLLIGLITFWIIRRRRKSKV